MPSEPLILAFDTSAAHCAAVLLRGETVLASRVEEMGRGQAERLFPLLHEVLAEAGVTWAQLARIGVGIGPGNFTGIRISVAAARGLGLSLGIPVVGVSSLQAQVDGASGLATIAAPRGQVYAQVFDPEAAEPQLIPETEAQVLAVKHNLPLSRDLPAKALVMAIARLAQLRDPDHGPAPLYVRAADAAPPRDPAPVILP